MVLARVNLIHQILNIGFDVQNKTTSKFGQIPHDKEEWKPSS